MKDTEKINPKTIGISRMPVEDIVNLIVEESMNSLNAVKNVEDKISFMVQFLYDKIINGGKIIYVGAGTSGRIAAQDVIELYPFSMFSGFFYYIPVLHFHPGICSLHWQDHVLPPGHPSQIFFHTAPAFLC